MKVTVDQLIELIWTVQGVRLTDWVKDMEDGHPIHVNEVSAQDIVDAVLEKLTEWGG
jgi:hypothetical protein